MRNIIFTAVCLLVFAASPGRSETGESCDRSRMTGMALDSLQLLDDQDIGGVWALTSPLFQELHDQFSWEMAQLAVRSAYGAPLERRLRHFDCRKTYHHAPDGIYAIIQFDTVFTNKAAVVETVVIQSREDGARQIVEFKTN